MPKRPLQDPSSHIEVANELVQRCQTLRDKNSVTDATQLKKDVVDFLLILGPEHSEIREAVDGMMFVRQENRFGIPPQFLDATDPLKDALCGVVDLLEVERAKRLLVHVIDSLGPPRTIASETAGAETHLGRRKPGPKPRDHEGVTKIVNKYGAAWKDELGQICADLDDLRWTPLFGQNFVRS
jgi:hypothetical protein